jgi:hypothetical protein
MCQTLGTFRNAAGASTEPHSTEVSYKLTNRPRPHAQVPHLCQELPGAEPQRGVRRGEEGQLRAALRLETPRAPLPSVHRRLKGPLRPCYRVMKKYSESPGTSVPQGVHLMVTLALLLVRQTHGCMLCSRSNTGSEISWTSVPTSRTRETQCWWTPLDCCNEWRVRRTAKIEAQPVSLKVHGHDDFIALAKPHVH